MKKKQQTGVIVQERSPDMDPDSDLPVTEAEELEACIKDIMSALSTKDIKQIAMHVKALHDILHQYMDSSSEESESTSPHTYQAQNKAAAKEQE
jgi:hypothetical protein